MLVKFICVCFHFNTASVALDNNASLCVQSNQLASETQSSQKEASMQMSQNVVKSTPDNSSSNLALASSNDLATEGITLLSIIIDFKHKFKLHLFVRLFNFTVIARKPVTKVEKVDNENIVPRLLTYDVDKAAEQIHSKVNELMKELEADLKDAENADMENMDYEV